MKKKLTIVLLSVRVLTRYIYICRCYFYVHTTIGTTILVHTYTPYVYSCCPLAWNTNNLHGSMVSSSLGAHTNSYADPQ